MPRLSEPPSSRDKSSGHCVTVLLKPGVMDPVAQSALAAAADLGDSARGGRDASQVLARRRERRRDQVARRAAAGQRRDRAGVFRPAARSSGSKLGRPYRFELRTVPLRELDDAALDAAEPRRAALSAAGRDADDSAAFPRPGPRSDRRRAGNDRPNLERALQPQDAGRPDRLSRRARRAAVREHAQGDDLRRDADRFASGWAPTIGA